MSKLERILIIHPHLNIKGGSERFTKVLTESLLDFDYEVAIVTSVKDEEWFSNLKVTWYMLSKDVEDKRKYVVEFLEYVVKDFNPDAAIIALQDPYYAYAIKRVKDIPVVMYVHTPIDEEISEENLKDYEEHFRFPLDTPKYLKYVDRIIVNSDFIKLIVKQLWDVEPIVIYPATDKFFIENAITNIEDERENIVLYVGRFVHLKRQDYLVLLHKICKSHVKDVKLILAGFKDPRHLTYFNKVMDLVKGIEDVEIVLSPSDKKLLELYRKAKLYVHVRVGEHFGLSPIEAMLQGVITIVRMPSGLGKLIRNEVEGIVVGSDYEILEYMLKVLNAPKNYVINIRRNAISFAKQFHPHIMTKKILEVIESVQKT